MVRPARPEKQMSAASDQVSLKTFTQKLVMKYSTRLSPAAALENLTDDAQTLLAATADAAEEHVIEARERLAAALSDGQASWKRVRQRCTESAKATDRTIRSHPYQSIAIAAGVGALFALLASRR